MFRIRVQENDDEKEFLESTAKAVWYKIVNEIDLLRRKYGLVKMFSVFVSGEDLFGLTVEKNIFFEKIKFLFKIRNHI
jgi:hypothetical protein